MIDAIRSLPFFRSESRSEIVGDRSMPPPSQFPSSQVFGTPSSQAPYLAFPGERDFSFSLRDVVENGIRWVSELFRSPRQVEIDAVVQNPLEKILQDLSREDQLVRSLDQAVRLDVAQGQHSFPNLRRVVREEVIPYAGEELGVRVYNRLVEINPGTQIVAGVLGPDYIRAALHDVGTWKGRIDQGRSMFDESDGIPMETPRAIVRHIQPLFDGIFGSLKRLVQYALGEGRAEYRR